MATTQNVADYFLSDQYLLSDIGPLKLHTLCAYAQAISLAVLDKPIFSDTLEAWDFGPVVPSIYSRYEKFGLMDRIPPSGLTEKYARNFIEDDFKLILEIVKTKYGAYAAKELSRRSHEDFPGEFGSRKPINNEDIKGAFTRNSIVRKLRQCKPCTYTPGVDKLVPESEIFNILGA